MTRESPSELLVLHAVRVTGFAGTARIARRFALDEYETAEILLDAEARGWVGQATFADVHGWSLTERGRAENERQLAAELARVGGTGEVRAVYREFLPLNGRLQQACTHWQLRPDSNGRLLTNDHSDPGWDAGVVDELGTIGEGLAPLASRLEGILRRFRGYHTRFATALRKAHGGDGGWIDRTDIDSCHRVWFELHEDLIASLGLDRGTQP
ncbi:transcriptional regulator [Phytoactinopolyspora limicola]|uniref:transcriptional regulator n=1 Tax=Phytoactinopolyspora limicola TaxID=2715536 RepID=UPI00140816E4|nr:transcriptional regulator [Phytoactinopolyspora limicola]